MPDGSKDLSACNLYTENGGALTLGKTRLRDLVSSKKMADKVHDQITWIDLSLNRLCTSPVNPIHKALDKDWTLDSIYVDVRRMHAIREGEYPPKSPFPVPQQVLMKIPAKFEVRTVKADVHEVFVELTMTGKQYGKLTLNDISADLNNVSNKKNAVWTNHVSAPIEKGHLEAMLAMHMNQQGLFDCEIHGENFNLGLLNTFIRDNDLSDSDIQELESLLAELKR